MLISSNLIYIAIVLALATNGFQLHTSPSFLSKYHSSIALHSDTLKTSSGSTSNVFDFYPIEVDSDTGTDVSLTLSSTPGWKALLNNEPIITKTIEQLASDPLAKPLKKAGKKSLFFIRNVIEHIYSNDTVLQLTKESKAPETELLEDEIYLTESELRRIWQESSFRMFGRPLSDFNLRDSLLLIPDEDEEDVMGDNSIADSIIFKDGNTKVDIENAMEIVDPFEYTFTVEELQRAWAERSEISWGLPSAQFSEQAALLLMTDDDDEGGAVEESAALKSGLWHDDGQIEYASALTSRSSENDETGYWKSLWLDDIDDSNETTMVGEITDRVTREDAVAAVRELYYSLEDRAEYTPAWQKSTIDLSPDLDTQIVPGDIMHGNSYMTLQIPSNWDDPEGDSMYKSDTFRATATMNMPDEPLIDYTDKPTLWDILKWDTSSPATLATVLDGGSQPEGVKWPVALPSELLAKSSAVLPSPANLALPDWNTFDFSIMESEPDSFAAVDNPYSASRTSQPNTTSTVTSSDIDIDSFFDDLLTSEKTPTSVKSVGPARSPEEIEDAYDFSDEHDDEEDDTTLTPQIMADRINNSTEEATYTKFITPQQWLDNPEHRNHVGYEIWSKSRPELFDDTVWSWEDLAMSMSLDHLRNVSDYFLQDHYDLIRAADERAHWDRIIYSKLLGVNYTKEEIPPNLTPDINRGVVYSDNVIEMKGKMTLEAYLPPPAELFKDDKFTYNEKLETLNKIGTIREQYDWAPTVKPEDCEIDEDIQNKISPLISYLNHAAQLISTKNNVLIFNYKTALRHVIGIRATLISMARSCAPEIVDIRLETARKCDEDDY